jgi:hypothetical protein
MHGHYDEKIDVADLVSNREWLENGLKKIYGIYTEYFRRK